MDRKTLRDWRTTTNRPKNKLDMVFSHFHEVMESERNVSDVPQSGHDSSSSESPGSGEAASDSSKSSQENPPETPSRQVLQLLLRVIADELSEVHDTKWGIKV